MLKYQKKGLCKTLSILLATVMLLTAPIGTMQAYALENEPPTVNDSGLDTEEKSNSEQATPPLSEETTPSDVSLGTSSVQDSGTPPEQQRDAVQAAATVPANFLATVGQHDINIALQGSETFNTTNAKVVANWSVADADGNNLTIASVLKTFDNAVVLTLQNPVPTGSLTLTAEESVFVTSGVGKQTYTVTAKVPIPSEGTASATTGGNTITVMLTTGEFAVTRNKSGWTLGGTAASGNPITGAARGVNSKEVIVTLTNAIQLGDVYTLTAAQAAFAHTMIAPFAVPLAVTIQSIPVCEIGSAKYATLDEALAKVQSLEEIKLLRNIDYDKGIVIEDKAVYFNLNGFTLNVTYLSGDTGIIAGLIVRNGAAIAVGEGEMNIKGHQWGVLATPGSTVTVTNAEATGGYGLSANGEHTTVTITGNVIGTSEGVYADDQAKVTVGGNVSASRRAIYAATSGCEVTVHGSVIVTVSEESLCGIDAFNEAKIIVDGDITAVACGAKAGLGGEIDVNGNITVTGTDNCGVWVSDSGEVSVEGTITAQNYIKLNDMIKLKSDGREDSGEPGFTKYTDDAGCVVWVKKSAPATVIEVGTKEELADALNSLPSGGIIKLTANIDYNDSVTISKVVTFNVGPYVLNIIDARPYGIGLDVSGSVNLISTTGELNVTGGSAGVRVWNGEAASATVTNATATQPGGTGINANSVSTNTASVVVQGSVNADTGVYTWGSGSGVIVHGKVIAKKVGILAESGGDILVHGAIEAETCGVQIVTSGTITSRKGVTVTGADGVGVKLLNSGSMTIDGDITATNYINLGGTIKLKSDGVADPTKPGYTKYTDGNDRVVWVKAIPSTDITSSFTDLNFLRAVRTKLGKGTDAPIYTADVAKVTSLDVSNGRIGSLAGIEHFTALITLNCSNNALKTLDVSHLTKLVNLYCDENQLTALDVSGLTELDVVRCSKNKLTTLNVSGLTKLTELSCYENQLTVLDVSSSTDLVVVSCYENKLTTLNMSGLTNLTKLYCRANQLTALDVSGLTKLTELICSENLLTGLDVSRMPKLTELLCSNNRLTWLVLNSSADYSHIDARNNYMENESAVTGKNITWDNYRFRFSPQRAPLTTYALTVQSGTGGGNYTKDSTVTIIANSAPAGQRFKEWEISPAVTFTGDTSKTDAMAKFIMPAQAVTATAFYDALPASHYAITIQNDGNGTASANVNSAAQSEEITLTASANDGYRFKEWQIVSGGVTIVNNKFNMPAGNVVIRAIFEAIPVTNHNVTFDLGGGTRTGGGELTQSVANGGSAIAPTVTRSGYTFSGWDKAFTNVTQNLTVTATWSYNGGGGGGTGGGGTGGGSGSSSDDSSNIVITPPEQDKPNTPKKTEIKVDGKVDKSGRLTVGITNRNITNAINKAIAEAKKNGNEANGVTLVLNVSTGGKTVHNIIVNLPKTVQNTIINKKIVRTIVVVDNPNIKIDMDLSAIKKINKQANADVNITAKRVDSGNLTGNAKTVIGSRPVFDLKVNYGSGKAVQSFGAGRVSVAIPYTLGANEKAGNVQAVYIDASGKVQWLTSSVYDSRNKVLRFSTNHFSTYGVGYKQDAPSFNDIDGHWAKDDIQFAVNCGLFSGTSATTFSPNTAMTRGMFVTALGRLANADVSAYKQSSFTDVKNDAYYMGYIEWANKNNIVTGISDGKFAPDKSITREQMAVIMQNYAKTIGFTLPKVYAENTFTDNAKISAYAKAAVKTMQMAGVISGKSDNIFDPQGTAIRAEVSAVLRRFVALAISSDTAQGWTMNDSGKWMYYENGKPITGKKNIDGSTYTFDQYGVMADVLRVPEK